MNDDSNKSQKIEKETDNKTVKIELDKEVYSREIKIGIQVKEPNSYKIEINPNLNSNEVMNEIPVSSNIIYQIIDNTPHQNEVVSPDLNKIEINGEKNQGNVLKSRIDFEEKKLEIKQSEADPKINGIPDSPNTVNLNTEALPIKITTQIEIKNQPKENSSINENPCLGKLKEIGWVIILILYLIFFNIAKLIVTLLFNIFSGLLFILGGVLLFFIGFLCMLPRCICYICSDKAADRVDHQTKADESSSLIWKRAGAYFGSGIKFIFLIVPDLVIVISSNFDSKQIMDFCGSCSLNAKKYWETDPCDVDTQTSEKEKIENRINNVQREITYLEKKIENNS